MIKSKGHIKSSRGYVLTNQKAIFSLVGILIVVTITAAYISNTFLKSREYSLSIREITSKRTATSQTFYNQKTGKYISKFYAQPVNYKDSSSQWKKIDTDLDVTGSKLEVNEAPYSLLFSKDINEPVTFRVGSPRQGRDKRKSRVGSVSFRLIGDPSSKGDTLGKAKDVPDAKVNGNKAIYKNIYKNTDVERIATPTGLKQNYVLKAKGHPKSFKETLSTKLTPKLAKNGSINFYKGKELVASAPRPFLTDAKGKTAQLNYQLSLPTPDSRLLTLRLPSLNGLTYPITVDPSITAYDSSSVSGSLFKFNSTWPPSSLYTSSSLYVGTWYQNPGYGIYRAYVIFPNTSSIPDTATILSANLVLYPRWQAGITTTPDYDVKLAYSNINTTNPTWGPTLTTADWGSGTNVYTWGTTSSTFNGSAVAKSVPFASINKLGNTEYEVLSSIENVQPTNFRYLSLDNSGSGSPYLDITYSTGIAAPTINSLNADSDNQLTVNFNDNSIDEDDFHFYTSTSSGATSESGERFVSDSTEKTGTGSRSRVLVTNDLSSGRFTPNTRYYIRSKAHAHGGDMYSSYSNELSKVTLASAPENLTAVTDWDAINGYKNILNWRDPDPEHPTPKYHVYYRTNGASSWTQIGGETVTTNSYQHTNLLPGKTYYYRVFSVNDAGEENPDYAKTSILSSGGVVNAVSDADWSASEGYHVHLGWQDNDVLNPSPKYHVYYSTDGSTWTQTGGETITTPYYKHTGVNPNTIYYYKIYGVNSLGEESGEYAYTTVRVTPVAGGGGSALTLQNNLNGYANTQDTTIYQNYPTLTSGSATKLVVRKFDGISRALLKFDMTGQVPQGATITGATLSLYYYSYSVADPGSPLLDVYKLTSSNTWTESAANWSNIGSGGTWATSNPSGASTNLPSGFNPDTGFIPPAWTNFDVTQITQVALNNNNGLFNVIVKLDNESVNVNPINFYSKEGAGVNAPKLTINYISATMLPTAPIISSLSADSATQLTASFTDQSTNEDDFHLYMGSGLAPTAESGQINSVSTNSTGKVYSKFFSTLSPNTRYYIRSKAHDHNNDTFSDYSNEIGKYTLANQPQALRGQKIADNQFQIDWDADGNPAGTSYELYYGNTNTVIYTGTDTTYTHTTSNRINTYKVRAKNGDDVATDWTEWVEVSTVSPHANYTQDPEQCAVCHSSHTATIDKLLRGPQNVVYQADFCYSCHDGTGSIYNVKAAVDSNPFYHPIKDAANPTDSLNCTSCHDPHGVKKPDGTYYAKLLKAKDANNNEFFEGNEFCGACHGVSSTLIGGDHLSIFNNIPHNTKTANPPSGTKIKCLNCHGNNNSSGSEGGAPHGSDYSRITKINEENLCYQCHDNAANSENGINIKERFTTVQTTDYDKLSARHNIDSAEQVDADQNTVGNQPSKVECKSCHNPHKNDRKYKMAEPDNVFNRYTKTTTDPKLWNSNQNKGIAVLQPAAIQQANDSNDGEYPYTGQKTDSNGKDSFISSLNPETNYGRWRQLNVGYKAAFQKMRSIIEFVDLAKIPPESTITKATLSWPRYNTTPNTVSINVYRNIIPWNEDTVTWNNQPVTDPASFATGTGTIDASSGFAFIKWDITSLVQGWVRGTYANYGLKIVAPSAEGQTGDMYITGYGNGGPIGSSERLRYTRQLGSDRVNRPTLTVEYTTSSSKPTVIDSVNFCLKCHDGEAPSGVTIPNLQGSGFFVNRQDILNVAKNYLRTDGKGDMHGAQASTLSYDGVNPEGEIIGPYYAGMEPISCTDCHDPHGSNNRYHLKENINWTEGVSLLDVSGTKDDYGYVCGSCHAYWHYPNNNGCTFCHFHGAKADTEPTTNF